MLIHSRTYRADIDGLRAIAVLAVLAFHAFPNFFPGGFIGVDIFFVISGYLISGILFEEFEENRFTYRNFYKRRIRRIFPALFVVLIACLAAGWFLLFAREYQELGRQAVHGAAFIANFLFWQQSGYFDQAAMTKPLLHLWSLGIEEQFYIVWPPLLALSRRWGFQFFKFTVLIAFVSFACDLGYLHFNSAGAFYSPLGRFYELMIGGCLAYRERHGQGRSAAWQSAVGLVLIALGFAFINEQRDFPGFWALLPTLGTYGLISGGKTSPINRRLLSHPGLVWFGLISYPLYLWHWPLISFAHILEGGVPSTKVRIVLVLLSIALAWLTYRFIERPIRQGALGRSWVAPLSWGMIATAVLSMAVLHLRGVKFRPIVQNVEPLLNSRDGGGDGGNLVSRCAGGNAAIEGQFGYCLEDKRGAPKVAIIGDSKAFALLSGYVRESDPESRVLMMAGVAAAAPRPTLKNDLSYAPYQIALDNASAVVADTPGIEVAVIVIAARSLFRLANDRTIEDLPSSSFYAAARTGLLGVVDRLVKAHKKVVIVVDNPTLADPYDCLPRDTRSRFLNELFHTHERVDCVVPLARHRALSKKYYDLLADVQARYPVELAIFDPTEVYCDLKEGSCPYVRNGRMLYGYTDHISDYTSGEVAQKLISFIKKFKARNPPAATKRKT